ncbi:MAG: SnoaL-like domain-containing protein [Phycisphaerales bacterium]
MAKKNKKKPARTSGSRKGSTKKASAKKSSAKKSNAKKAGGARKPAAAVANPTQVSTGRGAGPREVGMDLVAMFNGGQPDKVGDKWWSKDITSIEGMGMAWHGRRAVDEKNAEWYQQNEIVGASAEGPYVGATGFGVKFRIEVRERATGKASTMEEIGVYTVRDGKIICEEFMYA